MKNIIKILDKITRKVMKMNWNYLMIGVIIFMVGVVMSEETHAKELNLLDNMNLPECRLTQEQDEHIKKGQ